MPAVDGGGLGAWAERSPEDHHADVVQSQTPSIDAAAPLMSRRWGYPGRWREMTPWQAGGGRKVELMPVEGICRVHEH